MLNAGPGTGSSLDSASHRNSPKPTSQLAGGVCVCERGSPEKHIAIFILFWTTDHFLPNRPGVGILIDFNAGLFCPLRICVGLSSLYGACPRS
jgi:hypothetical protein